MIAYKIDKQLLAKTNGQVRDMAAVLAEISPTLQMLRELINDHEASISSPSINDFRDELHEMVDEAVRLTHEIEQSSQKLVSVSDQASKHLAAIEEHFGAVLRENPNQPAATPVQ